LLQLLELAVGWSFSVFHASRVVVNFAIVIVGGLQQLQLKLLSQCILEVFLDPRFRHQMAVNEDVLLIRKLCKVKCRFGHVSTVVLCSAFALRRLSASLRHDVCVL